MALVVNCRVIANFRHKKTALGGLIKYAVIFYNRSGFFIVYALDMNNYLKDPVVRISDIKPK